MTLRFRTEFQDKSKSSWKKLLSQEGTDILEMALLLPVLLVLLLGIIEVGRYAELSILVTNAARTAVQYGAQNLITAADITGIQNAAVNDAPSALSTSQSNPTPVCVFSWGCYFVGASENGPANEQQSCPSAPITASCPSSTSAVYLQVTTHAVFTPLVSYPGLPTFLSINGVAQMRVAQ